MSVTKAEGRSLWPFDKGWSEDRFEQAFRDLLHGFFPKEGVLDKVFEGPGFMRVEELVDGDTAVVRVELPGIDPEKDVDISVSEGRLHIHAEREERKEEERQGGYRSEFRYGTFERSLRLPEGTVESDITATYKDGILEVRVPASAEVPPPVKVPVQKG